MFGEGGIVDHPLGMFDAVIHGNKPESKNATNRDNVESVLINRGLCHNILWLATMLAGMAAIGMQGSDAAGADKSNAKPRQVIRHFIPQ